MILVVSQMPARAQNSYPPGAVALVREDRAGPLVAMCIDTGQQPVQQGARRIPATEVWVGEITDLHKVKAGQGACDPAWSPDGRQLAVTAADGLWVFRGKSAEGALLVEAKGPKGQPTEFAYRAFSHPRWSPDGVLLALLVSNGGTSWIDVIEVSTGKLYYTSPPENYEFSWDGMRQLKVGHIEIQLPARK